MSVSLVDMFRCSKKGIGREVEAYIVVLGLMPQDLVNIYNKHKIFMKKLLKIYIFIVSCVIV